MTEPNLGKGVEVEGSAEPLLFSVVMPVYGTEDYIAETLDSILEQDPELLAKTEVIIVNDGSPDNSETVCLEYAARYPELIRYIFQENQGVSVARNRGIAEARGTLIGFIDSDDKYSPESFSVIEKFWREHSEEVDVVSMPLHFFDGASGQHPLNFKYNDGTRIIDVEEEFSNILLHITGSFIRREALLESGLRFEVGRKYSEDKLFLTQLIMLKKKYGVVDESILYYRKRSNNSSAIQGSSLDPIWYQETLQSVDARLFNDYGTEEGVPRYVQYVVAYDLQWRVKQEEQYVLSDEEEKDYLALFVDLLQQIDEDVIMALRNVFSEHKVYLLKMKNGRDPLDLAVYGKGVFKYNNTKIASYYNGARISTINIAEYKDGSLTLEGYFFGLRFTGIRFGYFLNEEFVEAQIYHNPRADIKFLGDTVFDRNIYRITLPVKPGDRIRPTVRRPDGTFIRGVYLLKDLSYIPEGITTYRVDKDIIIQNVRNSYLAIKENNFKERQKREISYIRHMRTDDVHGPRNMHWTKVLAYRTYARIAKSLQSEHKKIWLISDRPDSAGDNGEAFFEYLVKNCPAGVVPYFVLSKKSKDYARLSAIGRVVDPRSQAYKRLFLRADKVISSQANDYVINIFGTDQNIFRDLYNFDFVFLQHGVTLHDVASWLHHYAKNIKTFVTVAQRERASIVEGNYGYDEDAVVLTGFPRHDKLVDRRQKKIIVAPTWRHWLVKDVDPKTLTVPYNEEFTDSEFYKFYQALITDPKLNDALEKHGYTAEFLIHPSFNEQIGDFEQTDKFTLSVPPHNYSQAFSEAALMVTDYSSVAFDFAYLRKPVVYSQFDKEAFYEGHPWGEGYYSFDADGFGPVLGELEDLVDYLVESIERGCELEPLYEQRVNDFFQYQDKNNSQRLLQEIIKYDRNNK